MDAEQKHLAEKIELNRLIGKGMTFNVDRKIFKRQKGILGLLKKRVPEIETLSFRIEEPTLATLDRLASEQIDLGMEEHSLSTDIEMPDARQLAKDQAQRCAKIIALAVLGSDYIIVTHEGSRVRYTPDDDKLNELTELFFHSIKSSKLVNLVKMINLTSNLGDFCSSIRSLYASRTTMPNRVENKED